jgi:carboxyl-terminal processing protease
MLLACNKGAGMSQGFPDVCLTPAPPAPPIPIPYPNIAMHAMAAPFSPSVFIAMMPAIHQGSLIPMTNGMEPGVANPLYMQMGMFTTGCPLVMINCLPGIMLTAPTTGNMMNNPIGLVALSIVTNVFFSLARPTSAPAPAESLDAHDLDELRAAVRPGPSEPPCIDEVRVLRPGVGYVALRRFTSAAASHLHHALSSLTREGLVVIVLDLRGNPGGDVAAAVEVAGDFLEPGAVVAVMTDGDGDETVYRTRGRPRHGAFVALLVDGGTASAAEVFAGCLQAHGRAVLVGERTYGKGVARTAVHSTDGAKLAAVATFTLPDGSALDGAGLCPDLTWEDLTTESPLASLAPR